MERLRPRQRERPSFSGFTKAEVEKMEKLLIESGDRSLDNKFFQNLARNFNRASSRAGKPAVKTSEIRCWFQDNLQHCQPKVSSSPKTLKETDDCPPSSPKKTTQLPKGDKVPDLSELEFEAKSSKDGAWYDVDIFLAHRFLSSGEPEVLVRFVGFGAEEDEWVNIKKCVRERSVPLEHSECQKVKVGDVVLCFQERRDQAIYYDARVMDIQRRLHDIRGCRCIFLVRYDHDNAEERVRLRRLCGRPTYQT
ncbi:SAWADEE domain [Dillenia turbinata]|uniref:SAWADEE domain n=1 Tax=Dillenia turbinata TaxID=194707 RepID=A0AAN8UF06_9MAGN